MSPRLSWTHRTQRTHQRRAENNGRQRNAPMASCRARGRPVSPLASRGAERPPRSESLGVANGAACRHTVPARSPAARTFVRALECNRPPSCLPCTQRHPTRPCGKPARKRRSVRWHRGGLMRPAPSRRPPPTRTPSHHLRMPSPALLPALHPASPLPSAWLTRQCPRTCASMPRAGTAAFRPPLLAHRRGTHPRSQ